MKLITKIALGVLALGCIGLALWALSGNSAPHKQSGAVSEPTTAHHKVAIVKMPPATTTTVAPAQGAPVPTTTTPIPVTPQTGVVPTKPQAQTATPTTAPPVVTPSTVRVAESPTTAPPTTTTTTAAAAPIPVSISTTETHVVSGSLSAPNGQTCNAGEPTGAMCVLVTVAVTGVSPVPAGSLTLHLVANQAAIGSYVNASGQTDFLVAVPLSEVTNGFMYAVDFFHTGYAQVATGELQG